MSDATPVLTPAVPEAEAPTEAAPQTFTQDDLNRINAADRRKDREALAALQAERDVLAEKANKFDALEAEQMTAAEKAIKERDDALAEAAELKARVAASDREKAANSVALKVAKELGISEAAALDFADTITGDDEATMEESARKRFEHLRPSPQQVPDAVHDVTAPKPEDDPIRKAFLGK